MSATFFAIERGDGRRHEMTLDGEVFVDGRSMRRARPAAPSTWPDFFVEHPEHGWAVASSALLTIVDRRIASLPRETAERPIRYCVQYDKEWHLAHFTTAWDAAVLAADFETAEDEPIPITWAAGVSLVHLEPPPHGVQTEGIAVWSDGQITVNFCMPAVDVPDALEPGARELLLLLCRSYSSHSFPAVRATLLRVAEIRSREEIAVGPPRDEGPRDRIERLRVVMVDGQERDLWVRTCGAPYGYRCAIREAHPDEWVVGGDGVLIEDDGW